MTHPSRTARTMKLKNIETGVVIERAPPDARGMVESGQYQFVGAATPSAQELLETTAPQELKALGREVGETFRPGATVAEMAARLLPHAERGELDLPEPPKRAA